jgi:hypothetical protein
MLCSSGAMGHGSRGMTMYISVSKAAQLGVRIDVSGDDIYVEWGDRPSDLIENMRRALDTTEAFGMLTTGEKEDIIGELTQKASNILLFKMLERAG